MAARMLDGEKRLGVAMEQRAAACCRVAVAMEIDSKVRVPFACDGTAVTGSDAAMGWSVKRVWTRSLD